MPLVPTDDDTKGVAPAFWTPSVTKAADEQLPRDEEPDSPAEACASDEDSTADTQFLQSLDGGALPVFLDTTGRRRRLVRALLWVVCLAGLTYATVLVLSLLGHGAQSNGATRYGTAAASPAATGAPVASASAQLERSGEAPAPAAPQEPVRSPAGAAQPSTPPPAATSGAPAPSDAAPSTPAAAAPGTPAPTPSPTGDDGLIKGLWDTLFPWAS